MQTLQLTEDGMKRLVYADNAATTRLSEKAYERMLPFLMNEYGNASQLYSFARSPKKALKQARETIAGCIGALPEEIFFTSCGTESDNWVIDGAARQKMPIVTSSIEHHAVLRPCRQAEEDGGSVAYLPVSSEGFVSIGEAELSMRASHGLLSVMFANNEIGTIQPVEELAEAAHKRGWLFHTDAVQAVGHTPIDVHQMEIDMLSASAHKFNGPKGIGFLYLRKGLEWPSLILGGAQELGRRAGTENVASVVGMATALEENVSLMDENVEHLYFLERRLIEGLNEAGVDYVRNGSDNHIAGNVSLSFPGYGGETLMHRLDLKGICVSTGSACDSKETQVSHVLKAIGLDESLAKGTIRISLGKYNTEEDVDCIINSIESIVVRV